jgi:predicted N-acetyltransferase YhbS
MLRVGMAGLPVRLGISGTRRFAAAMSATEEFHQQVEGPHWYLVALGTRPEHQGEGLGSALVELGTARADDQGLPCYLETGTASNVAYYSRRGFEVVGQTELFGHTLTGMVRKPR